MTWTQYQVHSQAACCNSSAVPRHNLDLFTRCRRQRAGGGGDSCILMAATCWMKVPSASGHPLIYFTCTYSLLLIIAGTFVAPTVCPLARPVLYMFPSTVCYSLPFFTSVAGSVLETARWPKMPQAQGLPLALVCLYQVQCTCLLTNLVN